MVFDSTVNWFKATNDSMGMVTFATIIVMISNNIWQLDFTPRTWVRWMVYFDALAFLVEYIGNCVSDAISACWQKNAYLLAADLLWSVKDAFKYGYIMYKAQNITGIKTKWPCYLVAIISLLLYWLLCVQAYSFRQPDCSLIFDSTAPLAALYLYWTAVDIFASTIVIVKMSQIVSNSKDANANANTSVYNVIKFREEIRFLIASVGMLAVSVLSVTNTVNPLFNPLNIWRIVFVYVQLLLVMGSQKVVLNAPASDHGENNVAYNHLGKIGSKFEKSKLVASQTAAT